MNSPGRRRQGKTAQILRPGAEYQDVVTGCRPGGHVCDSELRQPMTSGVRMPRGEEKKLGCSYWENSLPSCLSRFWWRL
jgi:hypothetical protein